MLALVSLVIRVILALRVRSLTAPLCAGDDRALDRHGDWPDQPGVIVIFRERRRTIIGGLLTR